MKRKQLSEEQIIGILKEAEAGAVVTELCCQIDSTGRPSAFVGLRSKTLGR